MKHMRTLLILSFMIAFVRAHGQPDPLVPRFYRTCVFPPPDSVDVNGDGIADLLVHGAHGVATCDIPVSLGSCAVHVTTLPGTLLLSERLPMGGRQVIGFAHGDTIPTLATGVQDDLRIPKYAFIEGSVPVLYWTYGRSGVAPPALTPMTLRTFVYATTMGEQVVRGTFTLHAILEASTVRIKVGNPISCDMPFIVP